MAWLPSPVRSSVTAALVALVATAMFAHALQPVQAEDAVASCSAPFLIDGFTHGDISQGGTYNDAGDSSRNAAYGYGPSGATKRFAAVEGHVLVPQGSVQFLESLMCVDSTPYSSLLFSLEYSPAVDNPIWPTLRISNFENLDQCNARISISATLRRVKIGDLGAYQQPDGTFAVPSRLWRETGTALVKIAFESFDTRAGLKLGQISLMCDHMPLNTTTTTMTTTTSTLFTSTTASSVSTLPNFPTTSSAVPAIRATTRTRARRPVGITPRPAHTNVLPSARPVLPARPIVPVLARPVTVTLPVPRATPGFTFNLTTKTFGTAASPLVVVEFVPAALPRVTAVPRFTAVPTVRPPAKNLVQNDAATVAAAETSASTASATAERDSFGLAAPVAVGALVAAAVGAAIVVRQRRRRNQALRGHAVRTDDNEGDRAHDDVAVPLV
ncbi:hypothetical protein GGF32_000261 [Allomyces javanicus]|nr:hypothetical protein GGF32_000261 [Allomyces javanicus]